MVDVILKRRSIRKYKPENIDEKIMKEILKAGFSAPSARNLRPWRFVVIDDREKLKEIAEKCPNAAMLKSAPAAVIVCGNIDESPEYWTDDCAAATQNILLAATYFELGSCWCAAYPKSARMEPLSEILLLPQNIKPYSIVALGKADEEKTATDRFEESKVKRNGW